MDVLQLWASWLVFFALLAIAVLLVQLVSRVGDLIEAVQTRNAVVLDPDSPEVLAQVAETTLAALRDQGVDC